jgi:esterase
MSSYLEQFNYQFIGPEQGPRWIFLHGLMGYGINWRTIANGIGQTERVLLFDQRGHGKSFHPSSGFAPSDYADDLKNITDELGWEKFILVGHSMGGRNALEFAHLYPQKLEKLVIEDMGPEGDPGAPAYYQWLLDLVPTPFPNKLAAKEFFLNQFGSLVAGKTENPTTLGQYLYSNITEATDGKAVWRFSKDAILGTVLQGRANEMWDKLRALNIPTLIVRGENSKELTHETFSRMCVSNPQVTGVEISNAGHWVHSDQPQEFLAVIRKFTGLTS